MKTSVVIGAQEFALIQLLQDDVPVDVWIAEHSRERVFLPTDVVEVEHWVIVFSAVLTPSTENHNRFAFPFEIQLPVEPIFLFGSCFCRTSFHDPAWPHIEPTFLRTLTPLLLRIRVVRR